MCSSPTFIRNGNGGGEKRESGDSRVGELQGVEGWRPYFYVVNLSEVYFFFASSLLIHCLHPL
jgi:hypothetical protein